MNQEFAAEDNEMASEVDAPSYKDGLVDDVVDIYGGFADGSPVAVGSRYCGG